MNSVAMRLPNEETPQRDVVETKQSGDGVAITMLSVFSRFARYAVTSAEHADPAIRRRVKLWRDKAAGPGSFCIMVSNPVGDAVE